MIKQKTIENSKEHIQKPTDSTKAQYHVLGSCNNCRSRNTDVEMISIDGGSISEARLYCNSCGFEDYWAYGFYESGQDMESNCEKYDR